VSDEWDILERARLGDNGASKTLLERFQSKLTALALLITGSPTVARDVAQEALVRALRADRLHRNGSVQGYLSTIAYRLALKEIEQGRKWTSIDGVDPPASTLSPLNELLLEERDRIIARAIQSLQPDHRDILVLRFYGGQSYLDIAQFLNLPLGTVKSRIFYAVKQCRTILQEKGILE
jgi:RNA polymerase sigma-70 factor (ECF subfamily)